MVAPSRSPRLIIQNVAIVNPDSAGRTTTAKTLVIEHDRIVYVGPADAVTASLPGTRIDGRGKFLIPGLWDAHVHTLRLAPQLQLPLLIANGVTSVRDLGFSRAIEVEVAAASPVGAAAANLDVRALDEQAEVWILVVVHAVNALRLRVAFRAQNHAVHLSEANDSSSGFSFAERDHRRFRSTHSITSSILIDTRSVPTAMTVCG